MQQQQENLPGMDLAKEAITRAFEVTPDTVYGLLLGILLIMLGVVFWLRERENSKQMERLYELQGKTIKVIEESNTALMLVQQGLVNGNNQVVKQVEEARDRILEEFNEIVFK